MRMKKIMTGAVAVLILGLSAAIADTHTVYAYNYDDYEILEDKIRVDNKHDTASHVNLYILSPALTHGTFSYTFYQTDGQPYYEGAEVTHLICHTRVENLKKIKTFADGCIYQIRFGIENGKYVFSNNFCTDAVTLTPEYLNPAEEFPVNATDADSYLDAYKEYFTDVTDETVNIYCAIGGSAWIDSNLPVLVDFAKEHDNPKGYAPSENEEKLSDADEIRQALRDAGYENELLDEFLTELEKEEQSDRDTEAVAGSGREEIQPAPALEETGEPAEKEEISDGKDAGLHAWILTAAFMGLFAAGLYWQRGKRKMEDK